MATPEGGGAVSSFMVMEEEEAETETEETEPERLLGTRRTCELMSQ